MCVHNRHAHVCKVSKVAFWVNKPRMCVHIGHAHVWMNSSMAHGHECACKNATYMRGSPVILPGGWRCRFGTPREEVDEGFRDPRDSLPRDQVKSPRARERLKKVEKEGRNKKDSI